MTQDRDQDHRYTDRRLAQGWAAARAAMVRLLALTGWLRGAFPREGRIGRGLHRRACALLRPAERQVRRIIFTLAAREAIPVLSPPPAIAPKKAPPMTTIAIEGPLIDRFRQLHRRDKPKRKACANGFRLIEASGMPTIANLMQRPGEDNRERGPLSQGPRITSFSDTGPQTLDLPNPRFRRDRSSLPLHPIAQRMQALQDVIDDPARQIRRAARWIARFRARRIARRISPFHLKPPGHRIAAPKRGGLPYETLDSMLHWQAMRVLE